jgi:hypothetical protein
MCSDMLAFIFAIPKDHGDHNWLGLLLFSFNYSFLFQSFRNLLGVFLAIISRSIRDWRYTNIGRLVNLASFCGMLLRFGSTKRPDI